MIKLLFFGQLADQVGIASCELPDFTSGTVADVLPLLEQHLSSNNVKPNLTLQATLQNASTMVAVNQTIAAWDSPLISGDELAFMPPVSGG